MIINPYLVAPSAVAPSNTVAPVISGTQVVGSSLSCTTGTWAGTAPITYTYQWYRGASLISGATSNTYTLVQADAGNTSNITCKVTGTNIAGNSTATSNTLAQIFDSDANTFISSASITDSTQKGAINTLCINLKGYSIWTKMKAIYPICGGSASSHAVNLKTPGTYNLTFSTGWTHASTGMTPNGTSAYAATGIIPNSHLTNNSTHMSYYSRTNTNIAAASFDMGINGSSTASYFDMSLRLSDTFYSDQYNTTTNRLTTANTNSTGFYIASRTTSTSLKSYKNGTQIGSTLTNASSGFSGLIYGIYIGAINNNNLNAQYFTNRECALISIGDGLDDTESANFNTAVQAFQTTLSRNV